MKILVHSLSSYRPKKGGNLLPPFLFNRVVYFKLKKESDLLKSAESYNKLILCTILVCKKYNLVLALNRNNLFYRL